MLALDDSDDASTKPAWSCFPPTQQSLPNRQPPDTRSNNRQHPERGYCHIRGYVGVNAVSDVWMYVAAALATTLFLSGLVVAFFSTPVAIGLVLVGGGIGLVAMPDDRRLGP